VANPRAHNTVGLSGNSRFSEIATWPVYALMASWTSLYAQQGYFSGFVGTPPQHIKRMTDQCPGDIILISAGPDGRFGYLYYDNAQGIWVADPVKGTTDDIANFPLQ